MITVKEITMGDELYQQERELRNRILLRPIGLPDFGWEMNDKDSLHFVALTEGKVIGCVILYQKEGPGVARLMQMAVEQGLQKRGVGRQLIDLLLATARSKGTKEVTCHARADAVNFYLKVNFEIVGEPFVEADVEHFHMRYLVK